MQLNIQTGSEAMQSAGSHVLNPGRTPVRRGEPCPRCGVGRLDYNGLLDLECPLCGYAEGAGAGCT